MLDPKEFIQNWGYFAVFLGSLIEGEAIILTASALAAAGFLSIYKIMIIAFVGTLFADQGLYFVGYYYGTPAIEFVKKRFPKMVPGIEKGLRFLEKYQTAYILLFRFIYSIRIVSPIIIGSQKIPFKKFSFLNLIAAVIWTLISCSGGYFLGELIIKKIDIIQRVVVIGILVIGALLLWRRWRKKKKHAALARSEVTPKKHSYKKNIE